MGGVTGFVKAAMESLGEGATDQDVKDFIRKNHPQVPQGHIGLALRKLRSKLATTQMPDLASECQSPSGDQRSLFSE